MSRRATFYVVLCVIEVLLIVLLLQYRPPEPGVRNVVLVVFDTLRADRMSIYGHDRQTTPFLEQNESQLVKYTNAKAPAPWTLPSHASLFTGLMPSDHRAQWGRIRLDRKFDTLAETLRDAGFHTVSLASNPFFAEGFGLNQGFIDHRLVKGPGRERSAATLAALPEVIDRTTKAGRRLFLFLNFMDNHIRYNHYEYGEHFGLRGRPPIKDGKEKWRVSAGVRPFTEEDEANHAAAYDASVRYIDDVVKGLAAALQEGGILDETLVILTSDHGDGLGYHAEMGHSISVWEEQLAVPLLIRFPHAERGGDVVAEPVSLVELAPFILDAARVERPPGLQEAPSLGGGGAQVAADYRSYFSDIEREANLKMAELYPELKESVRPRHVLYCGARKLVADDLGRIQFFDLEEDPHETRDLAAATPPEYESCLARYREMLAAGRFTAFDAEVAPAERDAEREQEELEALKALGYVH